MLIDTHIHVGQFNKLYFSPTYIHELVEQIGLDYYAVSSTTQCEENYPKVLSEIKELIRVDGKKVIPVMWITPGGLNGNIEWYLESDIKWRMIKIHPFLNKTEWHPGERLFAEVLDIARELSLPLLIHTGSDECCRADLYKESVRCNPDITFVLAHGRPVESALDIACRFDNAYVDTAFMPLEHIKEFVDLRLSNKLLWGTDLCIPQYYLPDLDPRTYYSDRLNKVRSLCLDFQFRQIIHENAREVLGI